MIKFLCWLKLNSIETLISQALIEMEINLEEFVTTLKEKDKYEKIKENLRSENEKQEIMKLSSIKYLSEKLLSILCHKKNFSCVCIKWFKSAKKKNTKNSKLKLLTKEDTFG